MPTLYLIALIVGGALIAVSLLFGGDGQADADADLDVDADADADADGGHDGAHLDAADLWLPFASIRFWIFFMAFFGLTGTLLTSLTDLSSVPWTPVVSGVTGYVCGVGAVATVRWLMRNEADSAVSDSDLIGARATVLLPIRTGAAGKVRIAIKGQILDAIATTEDADTEIPIGTEVMVYDNNDDGELLVTRADDGTNKLPPA